MLALSRMSPKPEQAYRDWAHLPEHAEYAKRFELGATQFVPVEYEEEMLRPGVRWRTLSLLVANMVAQSGTRSPDNPTPINYGALAECLQAVDTQALYMGAGIHMPRIGCGLAGGKWPLVEAMLDLLESEVTVYDLP